MLLRGSEMEWFQFPHLKVVEVAHDVDLGRMGLQYLVVGKVPEFARDGVSEAKIQAVIRDLFDFVVPLDRIWRNGADYLIKLSSSTEYVLVLTRGYFHSLKLAVMPWSCEYGSTVVSLESQFRELETVNLESIGWEVRNAQWSICADEDIAIQICGIPGHLCYERLIHDLVGEWCDIRHIRFVQFTCFVVARTSNLRAIPTYANIGVKKMVAGQWVINVWPVWYKINVIGEGSGRDVNQV